MKRMLALIIILSLLTMLSSASAISQELNRESADEPCDGPVYKASEVSRKARITYQPSPHLTEEARANLVRGPVVVSAVLCRSGKVTDIQVIKGVPFGVSERAVEATRHIKFRPAEKDGQAVSQAIHVEYRFSSLGERRPLAEEPLAGRIIESVEIAGYREALGDRLWARMKTRGGEPYNQEHIEHDWQMLLELGDFDGEASTLRIEEGDRGGVGVVFQLRERPKH